MPDRRADSATDPIRLLAVIGSLGIGGSEKQLVELLVRLPRERFDPVLLKLDGDDRTSHCQRLRGAGIPIVTVPVGRGDAPWRWVRFGARLLHVLRRIDPDLVYAWLDETSAYLAPICRVKGIPCVVARRNITGSRTEWRNVGLGRAIRLAEARATIVTANSDAVAASSVERGHDQGRVRVVRNGHARLPPLGNPSYPPTVFGYVAQFRPEKGHHRLIDAVAQLRPGSWRVDLVGDGELRGEIEARVTAHALGEHVRFLGPVSDVRAFWRDRHVAMLLSDSEGSPNALLEAAFAGRPAIATATGGSPEVVGPGGILVELDDSAAVTRAMAELIDDAGRREAMGQAIWQHVAATYSIEAMLSGHLRVLEEAYARSATDMRRSRGRLD